jgi:hypothetical protein
MKKTIFLLLLLIVVTTNSNAQLGGLLKKKKETTEQSNEDKSNSTSDEKSTSESKKGGGNLFQKAISKVAKVAGNTVMAATDMTAVGDLANAEVIVSLGTNIFSKDLGLVFTDFLGGEWINNGDFTMLQIASKDGFQFFKYDGSIKVNGKELKHVSMGIHTVTETPSNSNKKITFEKNGTIEGSFEIPVPSKNIKLTSINGQSKDVKLDLTKDVELEIANFNVSPDALIRIDLITSQIGLRALTAVAYVKPSSKITIPAAAFRNIENEGKFNLKNSYLNISEQMLVKAINPTGKISSTQMIITGSNDGMWIDVTNSQENSKGIKDISGLEKKNAAFAMPLSFAKNIAVGSFTAAGTTYSYSTEDKKEERSTYESLRGGGLAKTTTTTTYTETKETMFPQIPDEYLNKMMEEFYSKLSSIFNEVNGSKVMPPSTILNTPSYSKSLRFMAEDNNTETEFSKSYQNLKQMGEFSTLSNRYYGVTNMLKDAKADALLKVSIYTNLNATNFNKPEMKTYLVVELVGPPNGTFRSFLGNTKYFKMDFSAPPYVMKKNQTVEFDKVFQVDYFTNEFRQKLTELKAKEDAMKDYEIYWNLQK